MKCSLDVKIGEWYRVSFPEDINLECAPESATFRDLIRALRGEAQEGYRFVGLDMFEYIRQRVFLHISAIFFGGISLGELENAWFGHPSTEFLRTTRVARGLGYPIY